jgi:hypothetical protein
MKYAILLSALISVNALAVEKMEMKSITQDTTATNLKGAYSMAIATMSQGSGRPYTPILLTSSHQVGIINPTQAPLTFQYTYSVCASKQGCITFPHTVTIQPGHRFDDSKVIKTQVAYADVGNWPVEATTSIQGAYPDSMTAGNTIYVRN